MAEEKDPAISFDQRIATVYDTTDVAHHDLTMLFPGLYSEIWGSYIFCTIC